MEEREHLAEAYYLVGLRYRDVGKIEKGNEFITMANRIYPDLKPETIDPERVRRGRPIEIYGEWEPASYSVPQGRVARNAVLYQFSKLLRGFYTEESGVFTKLLTDEVYTPATPGGITRDALIGELEDFFKTQPVSDTPPDEIFELETARAEQLSRDVWVAAVELTPGEPFGISSYLKPGQSGPKFYFQMEDGSWKCFAAGLDPEEMGHVLTPKKTIKDTLLSVIKAFVNKDADKAVTYFTDPIKSVPYNEVINHRELRETFLGFFEEFDFSSLRSITVTLDIVEAEEVGFIDDKTYKAYVDFPSHVEKNLPFWTEFSGYYFVYDVKAGSWKIAAIF